MYLLLALVMGLVQRFLKPPMWLATLIFVPATLGVIWYGTKISHLLVFPAGYWHGAILIYCFAASLLPMWLLQQPRGYLGGFVLYVAIGVGLVGILFGGFTVNQPAFKPAGDYGAWFGGGENAPPLTSLLFPFLFVTIACGACSGFHGLVCGGTTSKQVARESHCKPIGFGAMLLEGLVAVIALTTVMVASADGLRGKAPGEVYGDGLARFLSVIIGPDHLVFARTFGTMAVATFIFDTLDVSTRLGRYLLQELFGARGRVAGVIAAAATAGVPMLVLWSAGSDSWRAYWTLFGSANQLLASLTLLGITVWLVRQGRRCWYVFLPMLFVMAVTVSALALQALHGFRTGLRTGTWTDPIVINAGVAVGLLLLAGIFVVEAIRALGAPRPSVAPA
jgi:carbon starvation protein